MGISYETTPAECYIKEEIDENTQNSAKTASFVKEVSPEMLSRGEQRGRTSHGQLGSCSQTNVSYINLFPFFFME